ncbi:hypothetical protein CLV68_1038 [Actinokineospora cianjurensis]|uniref:Uncharacterized protein n=1 Tax=Actinokineospora cianjurensis TaxID=585224 RepID=A0A421B7R3_9PSEU|nr:hypothetical protein CLV68_1038 [Actinokineospora cianjurensis]
MGDSSRAGVSKFQRAGLGVGSGSPGAVLCVIGGTSAQSRYLAGGGAARSPAWASHLV